MKPCQVFCALIFASAFSCFGQVPPAISTQPANKTVIQGSNATFSVIATGTDPLSYQWRFNSTNIAGATSSVYTRTNAQPADEGNYFVVVTNIAGGITSSVALLLVAIPPTINSVTVEPANAQIIQGGSAGFTVDADGSDDLTYQWRKNGLAMAGETETLLSIYAAQPGDEADYTVVVQSTAVNAASPVAIKAISSPIHLTVLVPPTITTQPQSQSVMVGDAVILDVVATGTGPLTYQWRKNNNTIPSASYSFLYFDSVQGNDSGSYTVRVQNSAGAVTSAVAVLTVLGGSPPAIASQPVSLVSCIGSAAILGVTATGNPPLSYQWRKNGTNLVDGGNVTGSLTLNLTLLSVSQIDTADYDVIITNFNGSRTSSVATLLAVTAMPARAVPVIANGFIVGAVLTDGGCGYTNPPTIVFSGQGGSGAIAYAQISDGSVTSISITNAGFGYPTNTAVLIAPPFYPTMNIIRILTNPPSAAAFPIVTNGFIVGANLIASGSGYTTPPSVSFSDLSGQGATAYAQISNGSVTHIVITSAGSGYTSNAMINISAPPTIRAVRPNAYDLMLGQSYQLQIGNNLDSFTSYGSSFTATSGSWTPLDIWNVANTNAVFFRMQLFP